MSPDGDEERVYPSPPPSGPPSPVEPSSPPPAGPTASAPATAVAGRLPSFGSPFLYGTFAIVTVGVALGGVGIALGLIALFTFGPPIAAGLLLPLRFVDLGISLVQYLGGAIAFALWMQRCYRNLPALGEQDPHWSPGWAAGAWFVPVGNLFIPYLIARELWRASGPRDSGQHPLIGCWWMGLLATLALDLVPRLTGIALVPLDTIVAVLSNAVIAGAGVLAIRFVHLLTTRQIATASRLAAATT
jgi:hypothetical protein